MALAAALLDAGKVPFISQGLHSERESERAVFASDRRWRKSRVAHAARRERPNNKFNHQVDLVKTILRSGKADVAAE